MRARRSAFYRFGLTTIRDELGWAIENTGDTSDRAGECNNTSDILATTLLLGQPGEPVAYADAAQIVRGHMMPASCGALRSCAACVTCGVTPSARRRRPVGWRVRVLRAYGNMTDGGKSASFNLGIVSGTVVALRVDHTADVETVKVRQRDGRFDVEIKPESAGDVWAAMPQWVAGSVASLVGARRWETSADEA